MAHHIAASGNPGPAILVIVGALIVWFFYSRGNGPKPPGKK